jgi:transcriptional regulator with XRE-family HTH domain
MTRLYSVLSNVSSELDRHYPCRYRSDMDKDRIRQRMDAVLQRRNISLRELAEEISVSHGTLSNIRKPEMTPSPETLAKLAPAISVDLDTLLVWAGHRPPPENEEEILRKWRTLGLPENVTDGELVMLGNLLPGLRAGLGALIEQYGTDAGALLVSAAREKNRA